MTAMEEKLLREEYRQLDQLEQEFKYLITKLKDAHMRFPKRDEFVELIEGSEKRLSKIRERKAIITRAFMTLVDRECLQPPNS